MNSPGSVTWKPVVGYEGIYVVSSEGVVQSVATGRELRSNPDRDGYLRLCLSTASKRSTKKLHRVVAEAFHGDKQNILHCEAAHLDGSRTNCRADNLKWVSRGENISHKRLHGTHQSGERHPRAKLTADQARLIHQSKGRVSSTVLAHRYGVSTAAVSDIWRGRRWRGIAKHESRISAMKNRAITST